MKTKLFTLLLISGFVFTSCEKYDDLMSGDLNLSVEGDIEFLAMNSESGPTEVRLLAGQHIEVGTVTVTNDEDFLYVTYSTKGSGWTITETHLHIGNSKQHFPFAGRTNNPVPGNFDYTGDHDFVTEVTWTLQKENLPDLLENGLYYIAAHAVVSNGMEDLDSFAENLPDSATVSVLYPQAGGEAYFPEIYISNGTFLDGTYQGWCIETAYPISQHPAQYEARIYSSYEDLPSGLVDYPENFNKVNWIINRKFIGEESQSGGIFTYGDVQRAIWTLLSDGFPPANGDGLKEWKQDRVDEILALAEEHEDYRPGCGDIFALIFEIEGSQNIIIELPVPCKYGDDETAWGEGVRFTERGNWAMWFVHKWQTD